VSGFGSARLARAAAFGSGLDPVEAVPSHGHGPRGPGSTPQPAEPGPRRGRVDAGPCHGTAPCLGSCRGALEPHGNNGRAQAPRESKAAEPTTSKRLEYWANRCSVAPKSTACRFALAMLGVRADDEDARTDVELRARAVMWVGGLRTKSGKSRAAKIADCGKLMPAMGKRTGDVRLVRVECKDRACPRCSRKRARKNAHQLRDFWAKRQRQWVSVLHWAASWRGGPRAALPLWVFFTLTAEKQPWPRVSAEDAIADFNARWRRLTNPKTKTGREFKRLAPGGVRAMEVTFSARSRSVSYDGFHPHVHVAAELAPGVTMDEFRSFVLAHWTADGKASASAQDFQELNRTKLGQLAMYVNKPLEVNGDRHEVARELFKAMAGKRMIQGWGTWSAWRGEPEANPDVEPLMLARLTPGMLYGMISDRRSKDTARVEFVGHDGEVRRQGALEVWETLERNRKTWGEHWAELAELRTAKAEAEAALARALAAEVEAATPGRLSFWPAKTGDRDDDEDDV